MNQNFLYEICCLYQLDSNLRDWRGVLLCSLYLFSKFNVMNNDGKSQYHQKHWPISLKRNRCYIFAALRLGISIKTRCEAFFGTRRDVFIRTRCNVFIRTRRVVLSEPCRSDVFIRIRRSSLNSDLFSALDEYFPKHLRHYPGSLNFCLLCCMQYMCLAFILTPFHISRKPG